MTTLERIPSALMCTGGGGGDGGGGGCSSSTGDKDPVLSPCTVTLLVKFPSWRLH
jgi:hypothetical protein